ncbi:MAG: 3-carboxy-cis,cis-muconate cycloisomerase [Candidatus Solibacter usitatus]|nr:3-carboxy-cis,cis-muconate cycloisomerase [Candidatus Solibacter usitatus]
MPFNLSNHVATTTAMADLFDDRGILQAMLDFEAALARVQARAGLIPHSAAEAITKAAVADGFDTKKLAVRAFRAGTLAIPLVKMLTARVRQIDPPSAGYVHWGATSQDVTDTGLVLLLKRAHRLLAADHARLASALLRLSNQHAATVMLGRTLLQSAPPVTFGLKAAGWFAGIQRGWSRVDGRFGEALLLQFGGASGTLAALGTRGPEVMAALAVELELSDPGAPWHSYRDRLAALLAACGVFTATLGKMARDISLLMQNEISEVAEPGGDGRGGSSTMPHKRNPVACGFTLAAATRVPALVAAFLTAMIQEQERGVSGLHAEWPLIKGVLQSTSAAVSSMAETAEGLSVDAQRMRTNIDAARGTVFAEKAMMQLAAEMGRDAAHQALEEAVKKAALQECRLSDVLTGVLSGKQLSELELPEDYLGAAEIFRRRLLNDGEA